MCQYSDPDIAGYSSKNTIQAARNTAQTRGSHMVSLTSSVETKASLEARPRFLTAAAAPLKMTESGKVDNQHIGGGVSRCGHAI